jgi:hypothetical protein
MSGRADAHSLKTRRVHHGDTEDTEIKPITYFYCHSKSIYRLIDSPSVLSVTLW